MVNLRSTKHEVKATAEGRPTVERKLEPRPARLRTETSYKAGSGRRVSPTSRSRSQTPVQVNGELAQRKITLLSGEICRGGMRAVAAPISKACLNNRNASAKAVAGAAEVSRGRITDPRNPIETGRTER